MQFTVSFKEKPDWVGGRHSSLMSLYGLDVSAIYNTFVLWSLTVDDFGINVDFDKILPYPKIISYGCTS